MPEILQCEVEIQHTNTGFAEQKFKKTYFNISNE